MNKVLHLLCALALVISSTSVWATNGPAPSNSDLHNQLQRLQQAINQSRQINPVPQPQASAPPAQPTTALPATSAINNERLPTSTPAAGQLAAPTNPPSLAVAPAPAATTPATADTGGDLSTEAFGRMTNTTLPLSPNQIEMLHNLYDATQQAASAYPGIPPRPTISSLPVSLSPGATPPIVRLSAGYVSSLVFVDSTGAPWPIEAYSIGNPTAYDVKWVKDSNILLVQAITAHRIGNMAVVLKGLNTPVMVELNPGQSAVDMRADLRVPGLGPNAKPIVSGLPGTGSPLLLDLLDGIPPPGSKPLKVSNCSECAWLLNGKIYLRTRNTVISPAWLSTMTSADGTNVYEMQTAPIILATYNGKMIKMLVQGY